MQNMPELDLAGIKLNVCNKAYCTIVDPTKNLVLMPALCIYLGLKKRVSRLRQTRWLVTTFLYRAKYAEI